MFLLGCALPLWTLCIPEGFMGALWTCLSEISCVCKHELELLCHFSSFFFNITSVSIPLGRTSSASLPTKGILKCSKEQGNRKAYTAVRSWVWVLFLYLHQSIPRPGRAADPRFGQRHRWILLSLDGGSALHPGRRCTNAALPWLHPPSHNLTQAISPSLHSGYVCSAPISDSSKKHDSKTPCFVELRKGRHRRCPAGWPERMQLIAVFSWIWWS